MRRFRFIVLVSLPLVLVGLGLLAWRWEHRGPGRSSVGGAIDRFRTSSTVAGEKAPLQPRAGVYVYDGDGTETLSFLGTHQSQGPVIPGTVVPRRNGCWQFRLDFNSFHSQTWSRCSTATKVTETGNTADQRFDFAAFQMSEHSEITCRPPIVVLDTAARPGTSTPVHCSGRTKTTRVTFTQSGTATLVGPDHVSIAGRDVPAFHVREDMHMNGGQTGRTQIDTWFAESDALPLKETHSIEVVSPAPSPLNDVTYVERGHWRLTSLNPRR